MTKAKDKPKYIRAYGPNLFEDMQLVDTVTGQIVASAEVEMMSRDRAFLLSTIYVEDGYRGRGLGSRLMNRITQIADENDITLSLVVDDLMHRGGKVETLSKNQLRLWYGYWRFVPVSRDSLSMVRQPRENHTNERYRQYL